MASDAKRIERVTRSVSGPVAVSTACIILFLAIVVAPCAQPKEDPPDLGYELSRCTRVEITFAPSALEYLFPSDELRTLLSDKERRLLEPLKAIVSTDREAIQEVASYDLTRGYYTGPSKGAIALKNTVNVVGYHNEGRILSFRIIGTILRTDDGYEFRYDRGLPHLHHLIPQVWPFALRVGCGINLSRLGNILSEISEAKVFPTSTGWCDAIRRYSNELTSADSGVRDGLFECPGARTCHYAMNPNCKLGSPAEMVLLFETKPGWNQQGGPELFTFDNHDPKGGLVLLRNATVKFIRTEEELKQLRWK